MQMQAAGAIAPSRMFRESRPGTALWFGCGRAGQGVAGFIVESEDDMAAIFDAISIDTPVYIY